MTPSFDHKAYREDLLGKVKAKKTESKKKREKAEQEGDVFKAAEARWDRFEPLRLARQTEEYHRARLLAHGNYTKNEHGELIEKQSGLSTQALADKQKLLDSFTYNIQNVLEKFPTLNIPRDQLQDGKLQEGARRLLGEEAAYGYLLDNASHVQEFAKLFGLENDVKEYISQKLDAAVKDNDREYAHRLLTVYPVFDSKEFRKRFQEEYRPAQGLKGSVAAHELFGNTLEGKESTISLDIVTSLLREKAEILANDIKKSPDIYWALKHCMIGGRYYESHPIGRWLIRRDRIHDQREDKKEWYSVTYFLGENEHTKNQRLEFRFSSTWEDREREGEMDVYDMFTTPNIFTFEGLYAGNKVAIRDTTPPWIEKDSNVKKDDGLIRIDGMHQGNMSALAELKVSKTALTAFAEQLLAPERDFRVSIQDLQELAQKYHFSEEEVEDMTQAIREFGTYRYRKTESREGDCLLTPGDFNFFCRKKFGIQLEEARYGEYHPEWGGEGGYDPFTFFHAVSVYAGKIVIDWTVTQYARLRDKPVPYIYEIGAERKSLGPLYKHYGKKEPNEQFIDDSSDPLYREEPPISYGI